MPAALLWVRAIEGRGQAWAGGRVQRTMRAKVAMCANTLIQLDIEFPIMRLIRESTVNMAYPHAKKRFYCLHTVET
jgi:hypothetical protein